MADPWRDINDPGFFFKPEAASPAQIEQQVDTAEKKKNYVEVRLSDPKWAEGQDGYKFNKKAKVSIAVQYLKETSRKRVSFNVFVESDGKREDLRQKVDGFENNGRAEAEITLYYGDAYSQKLNDDPSATCKYIFKATHPTGEKPVESEALAMPQDETIAVDFVEIADIHFHHNCALPCLDEKGDLISELLSAFTYAKDDPARELIIEGHADRSGDDQYNLQISKRRAESIKALLENDADLWKGVVSSDKKDHTLETEDYQQTLKSLFANYGWSCDPGEVDNQYGPKTEAAVKNFQSEYNEEFSANEQLAVDGKVGQKTWLAVFHVLRDLLEQALKDASLDPASTLTYGYPDGNGIYPCGESCPVSDQEKSEEDRRVELVFYGKNDWSPSVTPAKERTIPQGTDPVSEKKWDKKPVVPGTPAVSVDVSIKAEDGVSNVRHSLDKGNTVKCKAVSTPAGGTYTWTVSGKISIVGSTTNEIVEIKADNQSNSKDDSVLKVEYAKDGKKATASMTITVVVVTVSPPSMHVSESLTSGQFSVEVKPAGLVVASYKWLTGTAVGAWPNTAGNNPTLNYGAPNADKTIVNNTRWFAKTPSNLISVDGRSCFYKINCEVTIDGIKYKSDDPASLEVEVENFTGSTSWPEFQNWNSIAVAVDASGTWRVTGQGAFSRTNPIVKVDTLPSSQFYTKVLQHENLHVKQWTSQNPWQSLFNANNLYNSTIRNLTSKVSEADLRSKIWSAVQAQSNADSIVASNTMCQREHAAWVYENTVAPDFLELTLADWKAAYGCP
jgi:outer membrane protein OmpA-like peptidoglycan-associated protein